MNLLTVNADLSRTANALERIADSLELLVEYTVDPATVRLSRRKRAPQDWHPPKPEEQLRVADDESLWKKELEDREARRISLGLPAGTEVEEDSETLS